MDQILNRAVTLSLPTMLTKPIDVRMNVVKPLSGIWMRIVYQYIKSRPDIIKGGYHESGITVITQVYIHIFIRINYINDW